MSRAKAKPRPLKRIRKIHLESDMPRGAVGRIIGELGNPAEQLQHLGKALWNALEAGRVVDEPRTHSMRGDAADSIRQVATTVRANASQAMLIAARAMELAGQLDGVATIYESAQRSEDDDDD